MPSYDLLNDLQSQLTGAIATYYPQLVTFGTDLLGAIALLGFGLVTVQVLWTRDIPGAADDLLAGILKLGLCYAVMGNILSWANALVDTGIIIGQDITGISPYTLTPSGIYGQGLALTDALFASRSFGAWFHLTDDVVNLVLAIIVPLIWLAAAFIWLFTYVEALWTVATGPVYIAFAANEYTFEMIIRWVWRLLAVSLKLLALALVLAVGMKLAGIWTGFLSGAGLDVNKHRLFYDTLSIATSIAFLLCTWFLPNAAQRFAATHQPAFGVGEGILATTAAVGTHAAGSAATSVARTAAQGAAGIAAGAAQGAGALAQKVQSMLMKP